MQFNLIFIGLATLLDRYGKGSRNFWGRVYFYAILVFYILRAFLIKQFFHSHLMDMIWL